MFVNAKIKTKQQEKNVQRQQGNYAKKTRHGANINSIFVKYKKKKLHIYRKNEKAEKLKMDSTGQKQFSKTIT